jgi:hypothetical protein
MIAAFANLRALVYLKRITLALESLAESQRTLARVATQPPPPAPSPKMTAFGRMNREAAEARADERRLREAGGVR